MQAQGKQFSQQEMDRLIENARCEERARAEEQLRETKGKLKHLEAESLEVHKRAFRSELQQLGYTPAILDSQEMGTLVTYLTDRNEPVRFGEEEVTPLKLFSRILQLISARAGERQLFVEMGERADSGKFQTFDDMGDTSQDDAITRLGEQVDPTSVRRYVQARELAEAEGMAFRDALQQVTANNA